MSKCRQSISSCKRHRSHTSCWSTTFACGLCCDDCGCEPSMQALSTCHCSNHLAQITEHPSLFVYVCSPSPTCSRFWNQKPSPAAYQQTWTMPHRAHSGWQGFPELNTHVTSFSRSAWGRNVFYGLTFFVPRVAAALVKFLSPANMQCGCPATWFCTAQDDLCGVCWRLALHFSAPFL